MSYEAIKEGFEEIFKKVKTDPDIIEEKLKRYFHTSKILEILGYAEEDIHVEGLIRRKRTDIHCLDDYGNVVFVIEFKKPTIKNLDEHFPQLWDDYVKPLKADYGALTNGYELLIFKRINSNYERILKINLSEVLFDDCKKIFNALSKPKYEITDINEVLKYFKRFDNPSERITLTTEESREHFFENFKLEKDSVFSKLVVKMMGLFDYERGKSKFLDSAYDFWEKSYSKEPESIPKDWEEIIKHAYPNVNKKNLFKFMFCLETTYALFTRLILAKACEDYKFPSIEFSNFIKNEIERTSFKGDIPQAGWAILVHKLVENMRCNLIESIFEEDIFYWWVDDFRDLKGRELFGEELKKEHVSFGGALAKLLMTLYKFDFSEVMGDPLGTLYQKYFDKNTRKTLGEFYTPKEVVHYIIDSVGYGGRGVLNKRLLDPACGSGTFLVEALKKYLREADVEAKDKGWVHILKRLCKEYHIVGFDIHPFATIMAQIQFMLVLIPYYKKAVDEDRSFILKRIPVFRTDSLIDETKTAKRTLKTSGKDILMNVQLPVKEKEGGFATFEIMMPSTKEVLNPEKTDLYNLEEYFSALQAMFDVVKENAKNEKYSIEREKLESKFKEYLEDKDWKKLSLFFEPYGRYLLSEIKRLKDDFGDGRLVKSIEDVVLASLLKNYVKYDFVVGNPPYVRTGNFSKQENKRYREDFYTPYGSFDIYVPFLEKGIAWLLESGKIGFITSNKYFVADYGKILRLYILNNCEIEQLLDISFCPDVFEEPLIYSAISIFKKREGELIKNKKIIAPQKNKIKVIIGLKNDINILKEILNKIQNKEFENTEFIISECGQERFANNNDFWFDVYAIGYDPILDKINRNSSKLISRFDVKGGFMGYEYHEAEKYITNKIQKGNNEFKKILTPSLISPYEILWGRKEINVFDKKFKEIYLNHDPNIRDILWNFFESKKVVVRGIARKTSAAIDDEGLALLVNVFGITPKNGEQSVKLLVGILNSQLSDFYHKIYFFLARIPEGSFRYPKPFWESFPILDETSSNKEIIEKIERKVDELIFNLKVKEKVDEFLKSFLEDYGYKDLEFDKIPLKFNFSHKKVLTELEENLDSGYNVIIAKEEPIFVESEEKAKYVQISLSGRNFNKGSKFDVLIPKSERVVNEILEKHNKDKEKLGGGVSIQNLEKEINELVYELYGLDNEDKKIIEKFLDKF